MSKKDADKLRSMLGGDFDKLMLGLAEGVKVPATNEENCGPCLLPFCENRTAHRRPGLHAKFKTLTQDDMRECYVPDMTEFEAEVH